MPPENDERNENKFHIGPGEENENSRKQIKIRVFDVAVLGCAQRLVALV